MKEQVLTIEQMQELIDMGINTFKASMFWYIKANPITKGWDKPELCMQEPLWTSPPNKVIPTFTLQDMLDMIPKTITAYKDGSILSLIITVTSSGNYAIMYDNPFYKNGKVGLVKSYSLLEAAFSMLKWCKENKYI